MNEIITNILIEQFDSGSNGMHKIKKKAKSGIDTTKYHTYPRHILESDKTQGNITHKRTKWSVRSILTNMSLRTQKH